MGWVTGFEDMIHGEDGQSPIRKTVERVLDEAKKDEERLRIEIRSKPDGVPSSRQEHVFAIDPSVASPEGIMRALVQRLNESPGEEFSGELRINFSAAGASQEKYGSFTRTIRSPSTHSAPGMNRVRIVSTPSPEDEEEIDNDAEGVLDRPERRPSSFPSPYRGMDGGGGGGGSLTNEQMHQWLETSFGFTFRAMAQNMAMFERATRMMESYTLRFGMPHPVEAGIVEQRGGDANGGGGAMGMLPMLLNAAAHMANAGSAPEAVERAGSMAQGQPPPDGSARQAAIQGAARLVSSLPRIGQPPRHAPPPMRRGRPEPEPEDEGGGGAYFGEGMDEDDGGGEEAMVPYGDRNESPPSPMSIRDLPADQVKDLFLEWIRADPSRKNEVVSMIPSITKELG